MANSDDYRGLAEGEGGERARTGNDVTRAKKPLHLLRITIENHVAAAAAASREWSCDPDKKYGQCIAGLDNSPRPREREREREREMA